MIDGKPVDVIYLDLQKEFDKVYHSLRYDPMIVADDRRGTMMDVLAVKDRHSSLSSAWRRRIIEDYIKSWKDMVSLVRFFVG